MEPLTKENVLDHIIEYGALLDALETHEMPRYVLVTWPFFEEGEQMVEFEKQDLSMSGHGPMTIMHDMAEHELFLSFNGDDQALAFEEWMEGPGIDAFKEWLKTYKPL